MADPVIPNFTNGIGRLATDRYTYEKHTTGLDDRHKASQIDLFPTVIIDSGERSTVQDAIFAISEVIGDPPPDASTTVKGIVKLAGDIAGTATSVVVKGLRGYPISAPSNLTSGDVLTWNGSAWINLPPSSQSITNLTVPGNTILGTNSGNTLIVNAQATMSSLIVSNNTYLGNSGSDSTIITGNLTSSNGNISLTGLTTATYAANTNLTVSGGSTAAFTSGGTMSLLAGSNLSLTGSNNLNLTGSNGVNLSGGGGTVTMTGSHYSIAPTTMIINPVQYCLFRGDFQQNTGSLTISSGASFFLNSGSTVNVGTNIVMVGQGKINRKYNNGPNLDFDIYPALYDVYFINTFGITANRTYQINETSFPATLQGLELEIVNKSAYSIFVKQPGGTTIDTVGALQRTVFYRNSTNWVVKFKQNILAPV